MEKQKQQQRDQAKNLKQQQQPKVNTVTSTASKPNATTVVHLDPIQSIANVLNHHHLEQQKSKQTKQAASLASSEAREKNLVSLSPAAETSPREFGRDASKEESVVAGVELWRGQKRADSRVVEQQVDRVTGRPLLLTVDNTGAKNKKQSQEQQAAELRTASTKEFDTFGQSPGRSADLVAADTTNSSANTTSNRSGDYRSAQVDQGNSYLYAYNDFITSPSTGQHLSSASNQRHHQSEAGESLRGTEETQQQQDAEHDSRIARHPKQRTTKQIRLTQVSLRPGGESTVTTATSEAQKKDERTELRVNSKTNNNSNSNNNNNNNKATRLTNREANQRSVKAEVEHYSNERGEEELTEEDEEDDLGDETLSYILNRHNLLVARQAASAKASVANHRHHSHQQDCNLVHLNQFDASLSQVPAHLICRHQLALAEHPNHLRQYLQIEENFNNYKAARRKSSRRGASNQNLPKTSAVQQGISLYQKQSQLSGANDEKYREEQIQVNQATKQAPSSSFLPFQTKGAPSSTAAAAATANIEQQHNLSSSSLSSSLSSLANLTGGHLPNQVSLHQESHLRGERAQAHQSGLLASPRSYFHFLTKFAPLSIGSSSQSAAQKMYTTSQQVGQLAGQAGAYYVTSSTTGDRREQEQGNIAQAHNYHLQQAHSHLLSGGHPNHLEHHPQQGMAGVHAHAHHQHTHPHNHLHHHHQHSYPVTSVTSDSSLGSSGAFASSAVRRTTSWLRDFCSKRCLFVTCIMLILFIFILVISLSAYLNFLISANKVNLQPLSGRLRVMLDSMRADEGGGGGGVDDSGQPTMAQSLRALMMAQNSSQTKLAASQEFLQKQRDFETILRGALDRTQPMLKTYPNHLVKLEVYSFKPGQTTTTAANTAATANDLWVYFRLFVNKRSIQQDGQLMKRKSPDEQFDKQFLPRLTQQALLNGFEQLITSFGTATGPTTMAPIIVAETGARLALQGGKPVTDQAAMAAGQQLGINSRRFGPQADTAAGRRASRAAPSSSGQQRFASSSRQANQQQQQQLKSFDEQISRLMNMIEAIDLQSIFVTPDFDMSQTMQQAPSSSQIMSETLKASRPLVPIVATTTTTTTTTTTQPTNGNSVMVASGSGDDQYETIQDNNHSNDGNNNKLSATTSLKQLTTRQPSGELEVEDADGGGANESEPGARKPPLQQQPPQTFTLNQSYRENATRPSLAATSSTTPPTQESPFLVNQQQKPTQRAKQAAVQLISTSDRQTTTNTQTTSSGRGAKPQQNSTATTRGNSNSATTTNGQTVTTIASTSRGAQPPTPTSPISIPELWQNTFSVKPNVSTLEVGSSSNNNNNNNKVESARDSLNRSRLLTVTTIGNNSSGVLSSSGDNRQHLSPSEWQKVSVLESPNGSARAQLNAPSSSTLTPPTSTTTAAGSSSRPPKVAPHLNFAGSLVSTSGANSGQGQKPARQQQQQQQQQQQPSNSAVVLNRELPGGNSTSSRGDTQTQQQQPQQPPKPHRPKVIKQRPSGGNSSSNDSQRSATTRTNSTRTSTQGSKPAKIKKLVSGGGENAKNQTVALSESATAASSADQKPAQPLVTTNISKGIRIVDNFLASIGEQQPVSNNKTANSGAARQKEQPHVFVPTLPTTIELTRSTTSASPGRTTPLETPQPVSRAPPTRPTPQPVESGTSLEGGFVIASQQARPGTTSFSGQWRPLGPSSSTPGSDIPTDSPPTSGDGRDFWSLANRTTTSGTQRLRAQGGARPAALTNLSLIVATERLPATLNQASGSQSPFSMPGNNMAAPFSNRFRAQTSSPRTTPPTNDFESHRVSRMRHSQSHSHHASDHVDPFGVSSSVASTSSSASGSSSSMSTTTTSSSLNLIDSPAPLVTPANTRIVDDFMITTSRNDGQDGRATTLLPPLVLSGLRSSPQLAGVALRGRQQAGIGNGGAPPTISLVVAQGPKRTRGPFAFETLRSFVAPVESSSESISSPSEPVAPDSFEVSEPAGATAIRSERSSSLSPDNTQRQQQTAQTQKMPVEQTVPTVAQEKILLRKRLFIEGEPSTRAAKAAKLDEDELNFLPSTNSPLQLEDAEGHFESSPRFGNRFGRMSSSSAADDEFGGSSSVNQRATPPSTSSECPYFGCRGRDSTEFVCLNASQICDDRVDCQDETDELDCVSLLKFEPKSNRMSFSNGAGIIYLNRRGALAPMCLDYFGSEQTRDSGARLLDEVVRQINTIGQYACSLQSFSRLVSVKMNHHDLVDGSNQIRSSRLFHRLTVVETNADQRQQQVGATDSFKSSGRYQVSLSTSSECPSQLTVFVKCGGFECGQNSFSAGAAPTETHSGTAQDELASIDSVRSKGAPTAKGFPWLVNLYHFNKPACQGYLIDESWLVAARECFASNSTNDDLIKTGANFLWSPGEWSAEISYEHYGNDDDSKSSELHRRAIMDIIVPPTSADPASATTQSPSTTSSIVLAKFDRPVRFSPLNRPICLPSAAQTRSRTNVSGPTEADYQDCLTVSLPVNRLSLNLEPPTAGGFAEVASPTRQQHHYQRHHHQSKQRPDLLLNKVELAKAEDCFHQDQHEVRSELARNHLICAIERGTKATSSFSPKERRDDSTRVLICSQSITANSLNIDLKPTLRSRWVLVGIQAKQGREFGSSSSMRADGQLFASVSSQTDWIVDTMDPKSVPSSNASDDDRANPSRLAAFGTHNSSSHADYTNTPVHLRPNPNSGADELTNELNPLFNNNNQQQTCNRFKCSSGECLSWSRICDGLYDCSSHDDEKDCHK